MYFANPTTSCQSDKDLLGSLGKPVRGEVHASYGYPLTPNIPNYIVPPTSWIPTGNLSKCQVKFADFGGASLPGEQLQNRCPLIFQAPEIVLASQGDTQADIWSLGCTVLHLLYNLFR